MYFYKALLSDSGDLTSLFLCVLELRLGPCIGLSFALYGGLEGRIASVLQDSYSLVLQSKALSLYYSEKFCRKH